MRQTINLAHLASPPVHRLQDAAWSYAQNGWRIVPLHGLAFDGSCTCNNEKCLLPGQHPRHAQHVHEASSDSATIANWWQQDAQTNIGLATGDGLLVVELDCKRVVSVDHFRQQYAVPETAMMRTASGNWQLYFTYNRALVLHTTSDKIGVGIHTYGEGSYVVAPSSLLPGGPYYWHNDAPPARLPAVLLPFVLSSRLAEPAWSNDVLRPSQAAFELAKLLAKRSLLWRNNTYDE
jgi:hypothetical protein